MTSSHATGRLLTTHHVLLPVWPHQPGGRLGGDLHSVEDEEKDGDDDEADELQQQGDQPAQPSQHGNPVQALPETVTALNSKTPNLTK